MGYSEELTMTIGERIKFFRQVYQLDQSSFAKSLGVSQTHISKIENNKDFPSSRLLHSIAAYFGLNYEWLANGEGEMYVDAEKHDCYSLEQCFIDLQNLQKNSNDRVFEKQLIIIRKMIELFNQPSEFKNFKSFDFLYLSEIFSTLYQIQDFFIDVDKQYGSMKRSKLDYDECKLTDNYLDTTLELYTDRITRAIFKQLIQLTTSWEVMWDYIDINYQKQMMMLKENKELKSNN